MALIVNNSTYSNANPNGNSITLNHTHPVGNNPLLVVSVAQSNSTSVTSVTYNGQNLVQQANINYGGFSQRLAVYTISNPSVGTSLPLVINFSGGQFNPISAWAQSYTGAQPDIPQVYNSGGSITPHFQSTPIQENNSRIMAVSISNTNFQKFRINNIDIPIVAQQNTNKFVAGAISEPVPSGNIDVGAFVDSGSVTLARWEIKEFTVPTGDAQGNWLALLT